MIDKTDTAWVMISAILVMFMTPGLGFFYSGMMKGDNSVLIVLYCFIIYCVVTILWFLFGFSLVFGSSQGGFIGNFEFACNIGVNINPHSIYGPTIPFAMFFFFQLMFACITPALIVGTVIGRMKFNSLIIFTSFWLVLVYIPIAHWMWNQNGWAMKNGILDFAGGLFLFTFLTNIF
jgi:Amt family ammonium transporter